MDSTLQRSGKLLYVNALYHRALLGWRRSSRATPSHTWREPHCSAARSTSCSGRSPAPTTASSSRESVPAWLRRRLPHPVGPAARRDAMREDRRHYLSHVDGGRYVDECDVLGNVLAVLYGIAAPSERG